MIAKGRWIAFQMRLRARAAGGLETLGWLALIPALIWAIESFVRSPASAQWEMALRIGLGWWAAIGVACAVWAAAERIGPKVASMMGPAAPAGRLGRSLRWIGAAARLLKASYRERLAIERQKELPRERQLEAMQLSAQSRARKSEPRGARGRRL